MAGISSQALKFGKINKYRFQKQEFQFQEFSDGTGLNTYEFKYRFDDPQTGRFWQVDPLASEYEYNSPYAFSGDKVTSDVELEGLEPIPIILPAAEAATAAAFGGSMASSHTQELPTWNGLVNDINSLQLGARFQGMISQDKRIFNSAINAMAGAVIKVIDHVKANSNNDNTPATSKQSNTDPASSNPVKDKASSYDKDQQGSYTNLHESGKQYHGKGTRARSQQSGKEKEVKYNDPHIATDWTPSPNSRQALKDENTRIQNDEGIENPNNYNIINSPGKKIP